MQTQNNPAWETEECRLFSIAVKLQMMNEPDILTQDEKILEGMAEKAELPEEIVIENSKNTNESTKVGDTEGNSEHKPATSPTSTFDKMLAAIQDPAHRILGT